MSSRINVEITDEFDAELNDLLPFGTKSNVIRNLLVQLVREAKKDGGSIIGSVLSDNIRIAKIQKLNSSIPDDGVVDHE